MNLFKSKNKKLFKEKWDNLQKRQTQKNFPPKKSEENNQLLEFCLKDNIQKINELFGNSDDIIIREIRIGKEGKIKAGIIFTDGLIDSGSAQNFIMESLMIDFRMTNIETE
ncbi:spore germination protein, partial [Bacillus xiapuensis]|nr:spore germination protein [Bacillus xiapuensis]